MLKELTMYEAFKKAADAYPNGKAIFYRDRFISFKKLLSHIDKTASIFYHTLGIKENDVVLLAQPNIPETLIIFYALNKIGAVSNFVHPFTPYNQIQSIIKKTNSKYAFMFEQRIAKEIDNYKSVAKNIFVTRIEDSLPLLQKIFYHLFMNNKIAKKLSKTQSFDGFKYFSKLKGTTKDVPISKTNRDKCSILLHSGSTTGYPKTICLNDYGFNYISGNIQYITCQNEKQLKGSMMLSALPSFHGFGLAMTMHCMLVNKMGIVLIPKFVPKDVNRALNKTRFKYICGVPTMYEKLFNYEPFVKNKYLKDLRACYSGGDSFKDSSKEKINNIFISNNSVCRIFEGYGLTEVIAVNCVNTHEHYKEGSLGYPIKGADFKIVDHNNNEVNNYECGEITISSPASMIGYFHDEEATKKAKIDGYIHTGDLGYKDDDGFIYFKSRIKRIIKVSGVAVFPCEVEKLIESIPQVKKAIAVEIPDEKLSSALKVFVVASYLDEEDMKDQILERCRKYLIRWAVPKEIAFVKSIPYTHLGKVDYLKLSKD